MTERGGMNVIIVASFLKTPQKIMLRDPRAILVIAAVISLVVALGIGLGWLLRGPNAAALVQIEALQAEVLEQQDALDAARGDSERELNAMSAKLGQLQAHANRLNALGERLTRIGKLADGEFDFSEPPALGGPEDMDAVSVRSKSELVDSMASLTHQMQSQEQQLGLLESLLLDLDLEDSLLPAGAPVRSGYASSGFGYRSDPFTGRRNFHSGVDFNGPRGSDVLAVADGVVAFSGRRAGYGNTVDVNHGNGYMTRYAHNQENLAKEGDRVRAGEVIAKMGSTGRSTGSHVHLEVWLDGKPVNPRQYLNAARG